MRPLLAALAALMLASPTLSVDLERTDFTLHWEAAGGPVHDYEVQVSRDDGTTWETAAEVEATQADLSGDFGDTLLARVRARAEEGRTGPWSEVSEPVRLLEPLGAPGVPEVRITCTEGEPELLGDGRLVCR